jgi:ornithine carbamoyltransferase
VLALAQAPIATLGSPLEGKGVALIFEKPSNRTRHSMEMAVMQLGGHPVYTRGVEVGMDVRESVEDITNVMSGYHAMLCARVFDHSVLHRMAAVSSVPVVNMLSDFAHPLQAVADVLTMQQNHGELSGKTVTYVGDFNNVARSLCEASAMLGMHIRLGCPEGYDAKDNELLGLTELGAASVEQYRDIAIAVTGAHAVHTDTWTSMGQESESAEREAVFTVCQRTVVKRCHLRSSMVRKAGFTSKHTIECMQHVECSRFSWEFNNDHKSSAPGCSCTIDCRS